MNELILITLLFTPLIGGAIVFALKPSSTSLAILSVFISFVLSSYLWMSGFKFQGAYEWLPGFSLSIAVDEVSILLISLVTLISTLIYVFSVEYMGQDAGKHRYFFKLGLFTFSMIGLLLADHLFLLFVCWELVGLSSYLLIGFWYKKEGVPASARVAFMVNRVADVALLIGILIMNKSGSLRISELEGTMLLTPSVLIAIGAFGKSAQLPFSGWLTKAMVGPTPVSALIHAATMVAAGVYLLFRVSIHLHPQALMLTALIGTATAFYGGICALMQYDIKKVLAYSTISQLGYMFIGLGVGAAEGSLFHLFTHAFFKAGLFLGAGAIIHFMQQHTDKDAQDMRNMGGLKSAMPWTYKTFSLCALALAGIPLFSGFMSKEGIIIAGWEWASGLETWAYVVPDLALLTAFLTALYVGRMVLLVFWGSIRSEGKLDSITETIPAKWPLIVLAAGSLWIWHGWNPLAHSSWISTFLGDASQGSEMITVMVTILSILLSIAGLVLSYSFFKPGSNYSASFGRMERSKSQLIFNGFYLNSLYQLIGSGVERVSGATFWADRKIVDGLIHFIGISGVVVSKVIALIDRFLVDGPVNLIGYLSGKIGSLLAALSGRDLQTQLAWLLLGIILILSWILFL